MEKPANKTEKKLLGVVESLSSGFELILQNPWILLLPIALDFFLWLGPQISLKPILQQTISLFAASLPPNAPDETMQDIQMLQSLLQSAGDSMNLLGILAMGMPTVIGLQPPAALNPRVVFTVQDSVALLALVALLGLGAGLILSGYLEMTARAVRKETGMRSFIVPWFRSLMNLIMLAILVGLGLFVLMMPVAIIAGALSIASQILGSFLLLGGTMLIFWALLYLVFAVPAIFVSRVNAPQALLNSISIFRFDFWPAIGLVFIVYLIRAGFTIVWQFFADNAWGVVFDVIANAFLSSGLLAAVMIFYNDRIFWLTAVREQIRQQQQQKG